MNEGDLFTRCRRALGLSTNAMGRALLLQSDRNVRRWEDNAQAVSGPAWIAVQLMLRQAQEEALEREVAAMIAQRRAAAGTQ